MQLHKVSIPGTYTLPAETELQITEFHFDVIYLSIEAVNQPAAPVEQLLDLVIETDLAICNTATTLTQVKDLCCESNGTT